jgi:thiamine-phosphate pyrophosphorylase
VKKIGRLHVLTDTVLQERFSHLDLARHAVAGGADAVQFRQKSGSTREMIQVAGEMRGACEKTGANFFVNDRIDVAVAVQSPGVHLGQSDFPIPLARKVLGREIIIGGSASSMEEARKCLLEGADYIGFGPVYATSSKDDAGPAGGLELLKSVVETIPLPVIAIGGISRENLPEVMRTGVHGIAVISAVCCRENPEEATRSLRALLDELSLTQLRRR